MTCLMEFKTFSATRETSVMNHNIGAIGSASDLVGLLQIAIVISFRHYAWTKVVTRLLVRSRSEHSRNPSASCSRLGMPYRITVTKLASDDRR